MSQKIFLTLFVSIIFGLACFVVSVDLVQASATDNVSGWAWSENIGWISFNGDNVLSGADYGVHICQSDTDTHAGCGGAGTEGKLVGYAWSENIGWIMFNPPSPYPAVGPNYSAKLDTVTNQISGWARVCAGSPNGNCTGGVGANANSGGWDGWIKLSGSTFRTSINFTPSPAEFEGWSSSSADLPTGVVGWISFNKKNCDVNGNGYVDTGVCGGNDNLTTPIANYKVITTYSPRPKVTTNPVTPPDYCFKSPGATLFTWSVSSGNQSYFQLQIDNDSNFPSPEIDSCTYPNPPGTCVAGFSTSQWSPMTGLAYSATPYFWRVKVWDSSGRDSGWVEGSSFSVPKHRYPDNELLGADKAFNVYPAEPSAKEPFSITNNSNCYTTGNVVANCSLWLWIFTPDGIPSSSNVQHPTNITFASEGEDKSIILTMTDADGYTCTVAKDISVSLPLPTWKEITPR